MVRKVPVEICGDRVEMPVSFEAGLALEALGYDPLRTALRSQTRSDPLTSVGVIKVIHAGCKAGGSKLKLEEIGQAVYDKGANEYLGTAVDYLAAFVDAEPAHPAPTPAGGAKNGEPE